MGGYLLRRLVGSAVLLLLVLTATFFLGHLAPGDPTDRYLDPRIPREQSEHLAALYGLDRPLGEQYVAWLRAVIVERDWGVSFLHIEPVTAVLARFLPPTLVLASAALLIQYSLGLSLGVLAARRPGGIVDHTIRVGGMVLYSMPLFWLGLMLSLGLSHQLHLFPSGHYHSLLADDMTPMRRILDLLHHLALPAVTLGVPMAAQTARFVRNGLLDVMEQDFIRSARARGLSEWRVVWLHAMRNALVALTQLTGFDFALLFSGSIVIELVFSWPGIGTMTLEAIDSNDYPVMLAATAMTGGMVIVGNLIADLLHAVVDPRIRHA